MTAAAVAVAFVLRPLRRRYHCREAVPVGAVDAASRMMMMTMMVVLLSRAWTWQRWLRSYNARQQKK